MVGWGIIPARAGFTLRRLDHHDLVQDHPRSRGVYGRLWPIYRVLNGSSPLARGLPSGSVVVSKSARIIPARAGFTPRSMRDRRHTKDHPRSRGVYWLLSIPFSPNPGSSPLARGLREIALGRVRNAGIIPARAGFTSDMSDSIFSSRDHPRSRGVYPRMLNSSRRRNGSSPLARGLQTAASIQVAVTRIIPARAGFTPTVGRGRGPRRDHPRSRGVYERGFRVGGAAGGIIPARAGFTVGEGSVYDVNSDHPRSRGVYTWRSLESQRSLTLPDGFRLHC